jgi:hypothetical protein
VWVVFHFAVVPMHSPAVCLHGVTDLRRVLTEVLPGVIEGAISFPEFACTAFIAAVAARPDLVVSVSAHNLPPVDDYHFERDPDAGEVAAAFARLQAVVRGRGTVPPVFVSVDHPWDVVQGGIEVWRWVPPHLREAQDAEPGAAADPARTFVSETS